MGVDLAGKSGPVAAMRRSFPRPRSVASEDELLIQALGDLGLFADLDRFLSSFLHSSSGSLRWVKTMFPSPWWLTPLNWRPLAVSATLRRHISLSARRVTGQAWRDNYGNLSLVYCSPD
jgi:hypothetical protein